MAFAEMIVRRATALLLAFFDNHSYNRYQIKLQAIFARAIIFHHAGL